jgi:hypothetical protein
MEEIQTGKSELDIMKKKKAEYLSAAAALDSAIRILEGNANKPIDWKNSALDCLRQHGFPMRTIDILNCMAEKDPAKYKLDDYIKRRNYINALSIALNNLCDKDNVSDKLLIRMYRDGFKGFFYGSKEWFEHRVPPLMNVPIGHPPIIPLLPEIERKFNAALWSENSVFKLSKLEMDIEKDDD